MPPPAPPATPACLPAGAAVSLRKYGHNAKLRKEVPNRGFDAYFEDLSSRSLEFLEENVRDALPRNVEAALVSEDYVRAALAALHAKRQSAEAEPQAGPLRAVAAALGRPSSRRPTRATTGVCDAQA